MLHLGSSFPRMDLTVEPEDLSSLMVEYTSPRFIEMTLFCVVAAFSYLFSLTEMSCLMEALEDKRVRLQPECKKRLNDRIEMWSYAAKVKT